MSTRCQIRLIENDRHIDLYNHYDGYFRGVGKELKETLEDCDGTMAGFLADLLSNYHGYEVTNSLHADIEYFYQLNFTEDTFIGYMCKDYPWDESCNFNDIELKPSYSEQVSLSAVEEEQGGEDLLVVESAWLQEGYGEVGKNVFCE